MRLDLTYTASDGGSICRECGIEIPAAERLEFTDGTYGCPDCMSVLIEQRQEANAAT